MVNHNRIDQLEADALVSGDQLEKLEADALLGDARIAALVAEVEGLHTAMEDRVVIDQAKGVLMGTMHIGPDAAFSMLVAAAQRWDVTLSTIAERIVAAQDEPT